MGVRRSLYRWSRNHKVWAGAVVVCILYVYLLPGVLKAGSAGREGNQSQLVVKEMNTNDSERGRTVQSMIVSKDDNDGDGDGERALHSSVVDSNGSKHDRIHSVRYDKDKKDDNGKNNDKNGVAGNGRNKDNDVADGANHNAAAHNAAVKGEDHNAAAHNAAVKGEDHNAAAHNAAVKGEDHNAAVKGEDHNAAAHNAAVKGEDHNAAVHNADVKGEDHNAAAHNAAVKGEDHNAAAHNAAVKGEDHNAAAHNGRKENTKSKRDMEQNPEEFKRNNENLTGIIDDVAHNPDKKLSEGKEERNKNTEVVPDVAIKHNMNKTKDVDNVSLNKLKPDIKPGGQRDKEGETAADNVKPKVQGRNTEDGVEPVGVQPEVAGHTAAGWQPMFDGFYNRNETLFHKPVVKVLLLTYQRSGSSYTGELLTSGGGALYVFEPLFVWKKVLGPNGDANLRADAARLLGDLLDCRRKIIHAWQRKGLFFFRRKPEGTKYFCLEARLRLVKTIRARASFVRPWIQERPDIKVVHLVRDPRGIISSVKRGGGLWGHDHRNVEFQCSNIEEDLQLEALGQNRYLRVRYEDLVDHPHEETRRIFAFMGVDVSQGVLTYLQQHASLDQPPAKKQGYLNTYRDSNYRHDHWKSRMDIREVEHIQQVCRGVMERLGYTALPPT
ncbi:uncharacterized protein [Panulirus ornatus]|uniref:uncharacterized protein n=1 Tax=Panulirus ornatus TaxID=150431 RepID=UPI003A8951F4